MAGDGQATDDRHATDDRRQTKEQVIYAELQTAANGTWRDMPSRLGTWHTHYDTHRHTQTHTNTHTHTHTHIDRYPGSIPIFYSK